MPLGYPLVPAVVIIVSVDGISRKERDAWSSKLKARAESLTGIEAVMELAQELFDIVSTNSSRGSPGNDEKDQTPRTNKDSSKRLGRRWIWVHHITDAGRKKAIVKEATHLKLCGFLKPGYPGVVVEGERCACDDFVAWIKGNKSRPNRLAVAVDITYVVKSI